MSTDKAQPEAEVLGPEDQTLAESRRVSRFRILHGRPFGPPKKNSGSRHLARLSLSPRMSVRRSLTARPRGRFASLLERP